MNQTQMEWSTIGVALGLVVLLFVLFLAYSGAFHTVTFHVSQPYKGELHVAYFHNKGPYKDCGKLFSKVIKIFGSNMTTFALYNDNVKQVPADQCRYAVGVIFPSEMSDETAELLKSNGLSQHTFPAVEKAFMTDFPFTSFLSLYFMIWKVYYNMEIHMRKEVDVQLETSPCLELCGHVPGHVRIFIPMEKQEGFTLPEFSSTE